MQTGTLGAVLRTTIDQLRELSHHFDKGSNHENDRAFGTLISARMPALPEREASLPIEIIDCAENTDPVSLVKHAAATIRRVAAVLTECENVELSTKLLGLADNLEKSVIDQSVEHTKA